MNNLLSRRNFLQAGVLSGVPILLPAVTSIGCSNKNQVSFELNKNPLKLGIMTYLIAKDWDIDTIIKNLSETGYQSVELRTTHAHGVEIDLNAKERAEVKKRFEDSSLEAISLASGFYYHSSDQNELRNNIEGTKDYILLARDIGALGIRVFPNQIPDDIPEEQANREKTMEQIGTALAEVGEFAYNEGVEIRLCVHGRNTTSIPVIKKIIDYSRSPHVYINWNCNKTDMDGKGLEYNFNLIKDRIRSLHMHELWGNYPYRQLFRMLSDMNFSGYCNAEIEGSTDPVRLLKYYRGLFLALQNAL